MGLCKGGELLQDVKDQGSDGNEEGGRDLSRRDRPVSSKRRSKQRGDQERVRKDNEDVQHAGRSKRTYPLQSIQSYQAK